MTTHAIASAPTSLATPSAWAGITPERLFAGASAIYLVLSAVAFFVVRPTTLLYFTDYWEHRAIIAEVMRHGTHLLDPIYGEAAPSRQFTPWSLMLGYFARMTGLGVDDAMACGAMLVSLLFVLGVHGFARAYYAHRWAPVLLLVALTCGWGVPPLIWTGFYALRSQLHGNYYPAAFVFALTFIAWAAAVRLLRAARFGWARAALLCAVVACGLVTHPLNAAFLVAGAMALAVFEPGIAMRRRIGVALVVVIGVLATSLWPYFNPLSLAGAGIARGQQTFNNFRFFFNPFFVIALAWPGLFALLAMPGLLHDARARMPLIALTTILMAYIAGGIADISVSHRFLAYVVFALHILLLKALLGVIDGCPPRLMDGISPQGWRIARIGAGMLVLVQVALAIDQLFHPWAMTDYPYPLHPVDEEVRQVRMALPANPRILGWDSAALVMPAYGVHVVAFPRPMPLSPSDARRQADYRRFFSRHVGACERRAIAHRWGATHVAYLTNELRGHLRYELRTFGAATSSAGAWRIIPVPPPCLNDLAGSRRR